MPLNPIFIIGYCTLFALTYAWALVSIIERGEKKYRQSPVSFNDSLLAGSFILLAVFISNIAIMIKAPRNALFYNLALLTGLLGYMIYREAGYRRLESGRDRNLRTEMRVIDHHSANDPSNAVFFERASEIFEKLGELDNALEAARRAAKLGPTVHNLWRLKHLEEDLRSGKRRGKRA